MSPARTARDIIEETKGISLQTMLALLLAFCSVTGLTVTGVASKVLVTQTEFAQFKKETSDQQQALYSESVRRDSDAAIQLARVSQQIDNINGHIQRLLEDQRTASANDKSYQDFIRAQLTQMAVIVESRLQSQHK